MSYYNKFMKKIIATISSVAILISTLSFTASAELVFPDIENSEYKDSIENLQFSGVIQGYEDGTFRPLNPINRAEFTKIVLESIGTEIQTADEECFDDVSDQWFADYVCTAKEEGIIQGYEDGTFGPEKEVNISEALSIVVKSFDIPYDEPTDDEEWYEPFREYAHDNNIFSRYTYKPGQDANRGQMAFLVDQTVDIKNQQTYINATYNSRTLGCSEEPPSSAPTSFNVNGVESSAIRVIPDNYDPEYPYPLVFAFHGRTNSNSQVRAYYKIERPINNKAIIVYPSGLELPSGGAYTWSDASDPGSALRDYEFFDEMLEEISDSYCVNKDKVFALGHSLGGWFTNSLACARGDKIRAVASIGSARTNSDCTGPTAVMQLHNPNDRLQSIQGAINSRDWFLEQNSCSQDYTEVEPSEHNCVEYQGCTENHPVVWCPHDQDYDSSGNYYPHNWPRGTGEHMWDFFESLD